LKLGAEAPAVELEGPTGAWSMANALSEHARVMLVFYRGDW
jgi:peroxiredoxin